VGGGGILRRGKNGWGGGGRGGGRAVSTGLHERIPVCTKYDSKGVPELSTQFRLIRISHFLTFFMKCS
jgi:hypothetical protein